MKKRLISALLVLVLAICVLPVSAFADQPLMNSAYSSQSGYHDIPYGGSHHYVPYGTVISQTYNSTHYTVLYAQDALCIYSEYYNYTNMNPVYHDCIFGPKTDSAVRAFQSHCGLSVDGCVGDNTWNALGNCMRGLGY